jgi:hypothetical protein
MQYISSPVHTFCMGQAASMGSLLLAGGASPEWLPLSRTTNSELCISFPPPYKPISQAPKATGHASLALAS